MKNTRFFASFFYDNIYLDNYLDFIKGFILMDILHFMFLMLSAPQNMGKMHIGSTPWKSTVRIYPNNAII